MTKTSPTNIDVQIGKILKLKRMKQGKSLQEIANSLGVSFQQVQKYEKGQNKISSSNLYLLAKILDVDIKDFFREINKKEDASFFQEENKIFQYMNTIPNHELMSLIKSYSRIPDMNIRKKIIDLMKSITLNRIS